MRSAYHEQLEILNRTLGEMCELSGLTMEHATRALLQADLEVAEKIIEDRERMTVLTADAEDQAFKLLALQAPVAGELREVVTGFQIAADIDRMYALALHVAKVARLRHPEPALPEEVRGYFAEMGRLAVRLAQGAREVLSTLDPKAALALGVDDDAMDDLHRHLFSVLMDREWPHGVAAAVDVTLLGRYYERFADHAVAIGRRVVFQATGKTPEQFADAEQ
ncbi:phosphate transport system regulatory protein [Gordonia araii NBRC 100433]|uniref:Phosphate-specific transport system accessory protein PhoU n=1 Tax=Gordonia araii NBRC 100433 TaxID=1073574 RepID=G7GYX0_9ACTN|nr:phosphate signaling complex protein PhoU [Gordonia araii]NNG97005.1 phosphate signaling complex protein PhoU [Gordonia araii NBRC 100433]GAB08795.1 phosphate transport system regulatory protein [Gordonia araii NBRC 100433]